MSQRSLPSPFHTSQESFELIAQGAEALLYKTVLLRPDLPCALKIRPSKAWRHPKLDRQLTRQRILAEARVLVKCLQKDVRVPAVLALDWEAGWIGLEWIDGISVKQAIRERDKSTSEGPEDGLHALLLNIGRAVGKLHGAGIIHGDLTTSNMMLQMPSSLPAESRLSTPIVLIDFGLATQSVQEEDRAVDLYVLERAFGSTHPKEEGLFGQVLVGYAQAFKGAKATLRRLEDVRMRGRKKSMIG